MRLSLITGLLLLLVFSLSLRVRAELVEVAVIDNEPVFHWTNFPSMVRDDVDRALILRDFRRQGFQIPKHFVDEWLEKKINRDYAGKRAKLLEDLKNHNETIASYRRFLEEEIILEAMLTKETKWPKDGHPPPTEAAWLASLRKGTRVQMITETALNNPDAEVRDLLDRAQTASLKGEYDRALDYYNAALDEQPTNLAEVLYCRGLAYVKLKQDDKALRDFTEAIHLNPGLAVAYLDRGLGYLRQGHKANAMSDYNRAIALEPQNARAYRVRADLENDLQLWRSAIDDYTRAIHYKPAFLDALNNRANVYQACREYQKAINDYSQCVKLDSHDPDVPCNLAACYSAKGDLRRAATILTDLIKSNPKYIPAYSARARIYAAQAKGSKAVADARSGLRFTPTDAWDFFCRSQLDQILDDDRGAQTDLREALQRDRNSALYCNSIAWLLATSPDASLRNGREAVQLAEQANQSTGWRDAGKVDTLAAAYAEFGDFENAVAYQELACKMEGRASEKDHNECHARLELYRAQKPYRKPQNSMAHEP